MSLTQMELKMISKKSVSYLFLLSVFAGALLLTGCGGSVSATVKRGNTTVTGTVTYQHSCNKGVKCEKEGGVFVRFADAVGNFFVKNAMADTTIFDASTGRIDVSTSNVTLTTTSGTGTVTLYSSGTAIASNSFNYYVNGSSIYVSNPTAVNAWENTYQGSFDSFGIEVDGLVYTPTATGTATVNNTVVYGGAVQASSNLTYSVTQKGCVGGIGINCQPQ